MPIKNAHHAKLEEYFWYKSESEAIKIYKWPWSKLTLWKFSRPIYASFKRLLIFERRKSSCTAKKIQRVESVLYFIRKYCQNSITFAIPRSAHNFFFFEIISFYQKHGFIIETTKKHMVIKVIITHQYRFLWRMNLSVSLRNVR